MLGYHDSEGGEGSGGRHLVASGMEHPPYAQYLTGQFLSFLRESHETGIVIPIIQVRKLRLCEGQLCVGGSSWLNGKVWALESDRSRIGA